MADSDAARCPLVLHNSFAITALMITQVHQLLCMACSRMQEKADVTVLTGMHDVDGFWQHATQTQASGGRHAWEESPSEPEHP